jgi:hypothetical protein
MRRRSSWVLALLFLFIVNTPTQSKKQKSSKDGTSSSSSSSTAATVDPALEVSDQLLPYDFIFGFSTGHVGTTALNEGKLYGDPPYVRFIHELHYGPYEFPDADEFSTEVWKKANYKAEYAFVKDKYVPFLLKNKGNRQVLMDLGHNSLYFVSALVKYLMDETKYRFIFVRVRRERLESAVSLSFRHPDEPFADTCELKTRFCPYDRASENLLVLPSLKVWEQFTIFQKALWLMDETEARWNQLKATYPAMKTAEVRVRFHARLDLSPFLNLAVSTRCRCCGATAGPGASTSRPSSSRVSWASTPRRNFPWSGTTCRRTCTPERTQKAPTPTTSRSRTSSTVGS